MVAGLGCWSSQQVQGTGGCGPNVERGHPPMSEGGARDGGLCAEQTLIIIALAYEGSNHSLGKPDQVPPGSGSRKVLKDTGLG